MSGKSKYPNSAQRRLKKSISARGKISMKMAGRHLADRLERATQDRSLMTLDVDFEEGYGRRAVVGLTQEAVQRRGDHLAQLSVRIREAWLQGRTRIDHPVFVRWHIERRHAGMIAERCGMSDHAVLKAIEPDVGFEPGEDRPIRLVIDVAFAAPAAFAGYHVVLGLSRIGGAHGVWQPIFAGIGAVIIAGAALARLAKPIIPLHEGPHAA